MAYDLHGPWDDYIGLNAPLYESDSDKTVIERQLNVNASVHYWLRSGKIILIVKDILKVENFSFVLRRTEKQINFGNAFVW